MFSIEELVGQCRAALAQADPAAAVHGLVAEAMQDPAAVQSALGEVRTVGITTYAQGADLTVQRVVWGPGITSTVHEHGMWVVVGVYSGAELNVRYDVDGDQLRERERTAVRHGRTALLRPREAHSVTGSPSELTETLHIYGGDILSAPRREWISNRPRPFDPSASMAAIAAYNDWIAEHGRHPTAEEGAELLRRAGYPLPDVAAAP